jgi:hypothetical protein
VFEAASSGAKAAFLACSALAPFAELGRASSECSQFSKPRIRRSLPNDCDGLSELPYKTPGDATFLIGARRIAANRRRVCTRSELSLVSGLAIDD